MNPARVHCLPHSELLCLIRRPLTLFERSPRRMQGGAEPAVPVRLLDMPDLWALMGLWPAAEEGESEAGESAG